MRETIGRYRILREIGRGSTAAVYLAKDSGGAQVALKVLHSGLALDGAVRERFRREALAARGLKHPGIVAVYDVIEDGDATAIVMEHCPGGNLEGWTGATAAELFDRGIQLSRALAAAHAAGIVHRDLKPSNILVGADGLLRIADFGSARVREFSSMTTSSSFVSSPLYLAPESLDGGCPDPRWDLYSLGAILYRAATGRPHLERPARSLFAAPLPAPHPSELNAAIPRPLGDLIMALIGPLADRPRCAEELASWLETGSPRKPRSKSCLFCGAAMEEVALLCPGCLKEEPRFSYAPGHEGFSLLIKKVPEEREAMRELVRVLSVLSGREDFSPRFVTEDIRLYSKDERHGYVALPCRALVGLDEASAQALLPLLEGRGVRVSLLPDARAAAIAYRAANRMGGRRGRGRFRGSGSLFGARDVSYLPPLVELSERFDRPAEEERREAAEIEREALSLLGGGQTPAATPDAALPALRAPGLRELAVSAGTLLSRSTAPDPTGLAEGLRALLAQAKVLAEEMSRIDEAIAEISPGRLQASIRRLSELAALEEGSHAAEDYLSQKRQAELAYERYAELERRRGALAEAFLAASAELEALASQEGIAAAGKLLDEVDRS